MIALYSEAKQVVLAVQVRVQRNPPLRASHLTARARVAPPVEPESCKLVTLRPVCDCLCWQASTVHLDVEKHLVCSIVQL